MMARLCRAYHCKAARISLIGRPGIGTEEPSSHFVKA
jgi:hypothetical protein